MNQIDKIRIGITGTGSLIGQAIIKSIKASVFKNEAYLVGMDYFENTVGSYWCDKNYILPDLLKVDLLDVWKQKIKEVISENKIQILFIGVDFELMHFALLKEQLENETHCRVIVSNQEVIRIADDKYLTSVFLKENGLSYPETYTAENLDKKKIVYPCIVKPRIGFRSRGVHKVNNEEDLIHRIETTQNPIIQELVGDDEKEYTCGVIYLDEFIDSIALRRVLKEGNTSVAYYEKDVPQIVYDYIKHISEALKPYGACNFQLRIDREGIPKLFEINARHSGTTHMRTMFGFNEIETIIGYILHRKVPKPQLKEGKVMRYYDEMFFPNSQE